MSPRVLLVLLAGVESLSAGQPPKVPAKPETTASGVIVGRSGKPMAKARVTLGQIAGDQEVLYAKVKFSAKPPSAVADDQGRFQVKGFTPGDYTIVYQPAGADVPLPPEISIKPFLAVIDSLIPLAGFELGQTEPFKDRVWGRVFTLLKWHTFYSEGAKMKIWNATVRRGPAGPYMEIRKGLIWLQRLDDKTQIKFETWSY
ncbi:MAG: carboxypeptidase regulatory-like domain-containing protein [Acidobacteria bacterium]|nr:carboxypeptidase regulatory-like domain-containing protein [Acidobacteriota bacterium]